MNKRNRNKLKIAAQLAVSVCAAALLAGSLSVSAAKLNDIDGHWSKEYVEYGVNKGYINGYEDGSFRPEASVTRAEFSKMINSAVGISKAADISFRDVETNAWYYKEVRKAVYAGYTNGYEDDTFRADNQITREEAAVILSRLATRAENNKKLSSFRDADAISDWAEDAFALAYSKGYITGDELSRLEPQGLLTRGQAAKIIYSLITTENIRTDDYTVRGSNGVCSETIFTGDVIFSPLFGNGSLSLDGCRVLGSVKLSGKGNSTITAKDSTIAQIEVTSGTPNISLSGSNAKYVFLESPATLSGSSYGTVYLSGSNLISGTVDISAKPEKVVVSANSILRFEKLPELEIAKKVSTTVQSGTISSMTVSSAAAGSVITLSDDVYVEDLTVNGSASFMGNGEIENAKNNVSGVSYENKPNKVTGKDSASGSDDSNTDGDFSPTSLSPAKSATGVSVGTNIVLAFGRTLYNDNGGTLTTAYVEKNFEIRRSSTSGTKIDFSASLSTARRQITLKPDSSLDYGTRYYVVAKSGVLTDASENESAAISYSFTTASSSSSDSSSSSKITFSPKNGATDVSADDKLTITFSSAVTDLYGDTPTSSYLSRQVVELREKSTTGTEVSVSVTINSTRKVITVTPEEALKADTSYYLIVNSGTLMYSDKTKISRTYIRFTTSNELDVTVTPANGATGVAPDTEIKLSFNTEIYRPSGSNVTTSYLSEQAIELRKTSASGTKIDFTAVINSDRKTVRLIPTELEAGVRYYVVITAGKIANESGSENKKITSSFTVANSMTPAFDPANGSTDVSITDEIAIKFSDALYDKDKKPITPEYVAEKVVVFKKNSSSGAAVPFDVLISADYKNIVLKPKAALSTNTNYYVAVARATLYNESGKSNTAGSSLFKTSYSNAPDFLPYNGEKNVEVGTTIEITFDRKMYAIGGADLTTAYVRNNVIEMYKGDEDGTAVTFSVSLSSDKQTITVKPSAKLAGDTEYLVVLRKASLEDSNGNENERFSSTFTTAEAVSTGVTVTPANRSTGVSTATAITVEFESPVYRSGGSVVSSSYLVNNVFELRKGSSSGTKIKCTAEIDSKNRVITVTPEEELATSTTYYFRILSGSLQYSDGTTKVAASTTYFTTGDGKPVVNSVKVVEAGASYLVAEVVSASDGVLTVKAYDGTKEVSSATTSVKAGTAARVTVTGLASNHSYTLNAVVQDTSGALSVARTATGKTTIPFTLAIDSKTDTTITVTIDARCEGTLDLVYTNRKTGKKESRVTGLLLKENVKRDFVIENLTASTEYDITATFTDALDGSYTASDRVTTAEPQKEVLEITALTLTSSTGDIYEADIKDGKAALTIEKADSITLSGESSAANATFTFNGGTAVKPGASSQKISVTPGEDTTVEIELTSAETGNVVKCTLTVSVHG